MGSCTEQFCFTAYFILFRPQFVLLLYNTILKTSAFCNYNLVITRIPTAKEMIEYLAMERLINYLDSKLKIRPNDELSVLRPQASFKPGQLLVKPRKYHRSPLSNSGRLHSVKGVIALLDYHTKLAS
jgi:hypothetical protein